MILFFRVKHFRSLLTSVILIGSGFFFISMKEEPGPQFQEKVNLALRRTADGLLKQAGDSTTRIPNVIHSHPNVWQVELDSFFRYDSLPSLLQSSLDLYGIRNPYTVSIRKCGNNIIDLGYHQFDYTKDNNVPCSGREAPEGCHFLEITFSDVAVKETSTKGKTGVILFTLIGILGIWGIRILIPKSSVKLTTGNNSEWIEFGNSRLNVVDQTLICEGTTHKLTFRETKLLNLFATNPNKLLGREQILQQVWADEGLLVGRSIDVFVSRLRKKLTSDLSVGIAVVHGIGYRLEIIK